MRLAAAIASTALTAAVATAPSTAAVVVSPGSMSAHDHAPSASGLQRVLSHDGGQILACRSRSASGFISTRWTIRNTRRSDVVKAIVKHRAIDFSGNWTEWQRPYSTTGWVNPNTARNISKSSISDSTWSNHQTMVTVISRAAGTHKSRVLSWGAVPRC